MAEAQSEHRLSIENALIASQNKQSERGQIIAAGLSIIIIAVGTYAFATDHDLVAQIIFGTTVVGLVTVFALGKRAQKKSLKEKQ